MKLEGEALQTFVKEQQSIEEKIIGEDGNAALEDGNAA